MSRVEVVPGRVLRAVGFWLAYWKPHFPDPRLLMDPAWSATARAGVARYLRGGATSQVYRCWPSCEFGCAADLPKGYRELTDGVWVWPEDLAHYVEVHAVRLPEVFLEHVRAHDYQCPRVEHQTREQDGDCVRFIVDRHDTTLWTAWANERRACLDLSPPWQSLIDDKSGAAARLEARLQRVLDPASPIAPPVSCEAFPRAIARHPTRDAVLFLAYDQRLARIRVDWDAIGDGATPRPEIELFPTFLEWNAWRRAEEEPR